MKTTTRILTTACLLLVLGLSESRADNFTDCVVRVERFCESIAGYDETLYLACWDSFFYGCAGHFYN